MLRMFRRVRRQSSSGVVGEVDDDDRRSSVQRVVPLGLPARSRLQWWKGARSGAIATVLLIGVFTLLVGHPLYPRTTVPPKDEPNQERCPVYNAVTGETTVPSEDAPKKRKVMISPKLKYPIESKAWSDRVLKAKDARSKGPKGATPDQIGKAALSRRFEQGWGKGEPSPQQPRERSPGTGAVLTLLDSDVIGDVSRMKRFLYPADGAGGNDVKGNKEWAWEEIILCEDLAKEFESTLEGVKEEEAWRRGVELDIVKLVSCKGPTGGRLSGELSLACVAAHGASSEWLWVPGAAVTDLGPEVMEQLNSLVKASTVDGVFGVRGWVRKERPLPSFRGSDGRLHRGLAVEHAMETDDWTGIDSDDFPLPHPGAPVEQQMPSPELDLSHFRDGEAKQPIQLEGGPNLGVEESSSIDSDDVSLRQPRAPVGQQSQRVLQLQGDDVTATWEFVGGVVDQKSKEGTGDDAEVLEVDAFIDAVFVRADHLRHACSFISATVVAAANGAESKHSLRRGLEEEEGDRVSGGETGLMKLSAVSYVVRKTLGVRSFVKNGLLSLGGGGVAAMPGKGEVSVPGSEFLPRECLTPSVAEAILLSVTSVEDLKSLKPLLREFLKSEAYDPYLVLSSSTGSPDLQRELETVSADEREQRGAATVTKFGVCGTIDFERVTSEATGDTQTLEERWVTLLSRLSPVAIIAVHHGAREGFTEDQEAWRAGTGGDTEGERAARRACARAEASTAFIGLPSEEVMHALWLPRLAPVALASWSRPRFSISVITNNRPESLARLLASLKRSRLFGDELAVDFYVESSADDETLRIVEAFSYEWGDRGPVQTHFRVLKGGLIRAVTESFYPSDRHHHAFLLEDDVEISPHFYAWSKWATLTYQYGESSDFLRDMYGVSLYTPRVDELSKKRQVYDSNKLIASKTKGVRYSPFLYQIPCSWGAVFFPETWMEYRLYLAARLREDHIVVNIKDSKTNLWNTSWKRFFIEMAYQAQYYMLYPNFFNQTSFSTNWLELGEHIKVDKPEDKGDGKQGDKKDSPPSPPPQTKGDKKHLPKDYTVPLMDGSASLVDPLPGKRLPPLGSLPRMDILNHDVP